MEAAYFWLFDRLLDSVRLLWKLLGGVVAVHGVVLLVLVPIWAVGMLALPATAYGLTHVEWPEKALVPAGVVAAAASVFWVASRIFGAAEKLHNRIWRG